MQVSTNQDRGDSFGRQFIKYISDKLPYQNYTAIDNLETLNPKYKHFFQSGTIRDELLSKYSVSSNVIEGGNPANGIGGIVLDDKYSNYIYANVDQDKGKRLRDYRIMAAFSEVSDALDEICDEFLNRDNDGEFVKLDIKSGDQSEEVQKEIKKEFKKFVEYFNFDERGWEYVRNLLVDGELYFEHIIHSKSPESGILGIISIPTEIVDPIYDNVQNYLIKGFLLRKPILDPTRTTLQNKSLVRMQLVPLDKNQVTYINSGVWNEEKTFRLPFIEKARRAYRQLSQIEDAIVIYRLVRAPERLVFNVDVGSMNAPQAEAYLKRLMNQYWSRKTFDKSQGNDGRVVQAFNPQSMLDNFWFAKREGSQGTNVTSLAGGQNLGQLDDLIYFIKKLYSALKVPTNRVDPNSQTKDGSEVLREELKFAKFIIRLQQQFSVSIRDSFVTHLKLKKLWDKYSLKEPHLKVAFNPPSNFYELREQQKFELKSNNFNAMAGNDMIAPSYAQKLYLGWDDEKIAANREWLKKDAALRWEKSQIETAGPNWREAVVQGQPAGEAAPGGGGMGGGGAPVSSSGSSGLPPDFGPAPGEQPVDGQPAGGEATQGAQPAPNANGQPAQNNAAPQR